MQWALWVGFGARHQQVYLQKRLSIGVQIVQENLLDFEPNPWGLGCRDSERRQVDRSSSVIGAARVATVLALTAGHGCHNHFKLLSLLYTILCLGLSKLPYKHPLPLFRITQYSSE